MVEVDPTETPAELRVELHSWIISATDICDVLASSEPSRELSIVKTKLEEAEMWLLKELQNRSNQTTSEVIQ